MKKQEITPYPEIRDRLSTFTIINCEHKNPFYKWIGHTAVVYRCLETGQLMVLESNVGVGVHLTPMGKWLNEYPGKVFVRIPKFDFKETVLGKTICMMTLEMLATEFIKSHLGSSYPNVKTWSGKMKLILSALDFDIFGDDLFKYDGNDEGIFCTMLVIMFLQYCGLMNNETLACEWEPDNTRVDFTMAHCLINCKYGKEIRIK